MAQSEDDTMYIQATYIQTYVRTYIHRWIYAFMAQSEDVTIHIHALAYIHT